MNEGDFIRRSKSFSQPKGKDLIKQGCEAGFLHQFAEGQWMYSGVWVQLMRCIQNMYVKQIVDEHGFEEWIFPRLIPNKALDSFKLTHYKPGMLLHVTDHQSSEFARILDPVQCVPLYYHFRGREISISDLPIQIIECLGGWTWRNEILDELNGPIRAFEFSRIECVFLGSPSQVHTLRQNIKNEILRLLTDLEINWRVVVGAGCMDIPSLDRARRKAESYNDVPVHDVEILLPNGEWLEIAGCTVEGNHLTASFDIVSDDRGELWSGCCGLGMNRLLSGLLLQHGFKLEDWPQTVRKLLSI